MPPSVKYVFKMNSRCVPLSIYLPVFQEDRNRLFEEYYQQFPSRYKFIELKSISNMQDLRKLAEFIIIIIRKIQ